ncbi:MAG TPA: ABC transporter permease [Acidimicrobiia bacterium]|nr:ABC transporter permease [Acidimicrobiia bacterium]
MSDAAAPRPLIDRLLAAHGWLVYLFFYAPIIVLAVFSFNDNSRVGIWTEPSLRWYRQMAANEDILRAIRNTLIVAAISTVVSVVLGTAAAVSMERFRFRGQRTLDGLLYLPIIIPDVTMAVMMLLFFVQAFDLLAGVTGIQLQLGLGSISLAHIAFNISFVAVVVRARLAGMDPYLTEAAADLYAGRWQTFRKVTLPLIMPGVAGGALLALTLSLDDVVVTSFVTGPGSTTLPVYVFGLVRREVSPLINAVSTAMLVASIVLVGISLGLQRRAGAGEVPATTEEGEIDGTDETTAALAGSIGRLGDDSGGVR